MFSTISRTNAAATHGDISKRAGPQCGALLKKMPALDRINLKGVCRYERSMSDTSAKVDTILKRPAAW